MHTLLVLFGWPNGQDGQVWPNVIAGVISAVFVWLIGLWHLNRVHKSHQQDIHNHIAREFHYYLTERKPD